MRLALNMAKMDKVGLLCAAIEGTQYLIKKPHAETREEKQRRAEVHRHRMVETAI